MGHHPLSPFGSLSDSASGPSAPSSQPGRAAASVPEGAAILGRDRAADRTPIIQGIGTDGPPVTGHWGGSCPFPRCCQRLWQAARRGPAEDQGDRHSWEPGGKGQASCRPASCASILLF